MRYKATFLIGFGVGYTLGAKAGRERYEQIRRAARGLSENPAVQSAAGMLQAQASTLVDTAKDKVVEKVGDKLPMMGGGSGPTGPANGTAPTRYA